MTVYRLSEAGRFISALARSNRAAAERGLLAAAVRAVGYIQAEVIPSLSPVPTARGTWRAAWRAEKIEGGARFFNDAPHAPFIEDGVRGQNVKIGRAMIDALAEWVRMKGIGGRAITSKSGTTRFAKATKDEAIAIAWAIAKTLQKKGIFNSGAGFGVMKKAREQLPRFIREEVLRELRTMSVRE